MSQAPPPTIINGDDIIISVLTTIALIIIGVLLFELIIFIHEFGHFIAAKKSGIKVNEFALGMGPRLFGFTKGETTYSFRLFPIGGYCAMEGEDEDSENPRAFNNAKIWKRMIVIIAGAVMNILLGLVFMFITLIPKETFVSNEISMTRTISYSMITGLQAGDEIVSINGYAINTYTDFAFSLYTLPITEVDGNDLSVYKEDCLMSLLDYANAHSEKNTSEIASKINALLINKQSELRDAEDRDRVTALFRSGIDEISALQGIEAEYPEIRTEKTRQVFRADVTVIRDGERVELEDVDFLTTAGSDGDKPQVSQDFYFQPMDKNFGTMITQTFAETVSNVRMVWGSLAGLVTGKFSLNEMSGPIGIASAITDVASEAMETSGFGTAVMSILYVMMIITVNLGVINMLPFPALDGGRFLMLLIEAIFRKPVPRKVESIINTVGLILLLGLSAVIAVKDILKLAGG